MKKAKNVLLALVLVVLYAVLAIGSGESEEPQVSQGSGDATQSATAASKETIVHVGEKLTISGLEVEFLSAEDFTGYDEYFGPKEGNKVVRMQVKYTNTGSSDKSVGSTDFSCYADNEAAESYFYADDALTVIDTLSAGRSISGYVYFEVPENAQSIEAEFEVDFWSEKKAIFVIQ